MNLLDWIRRKPSVSPTPASDADRAILALAAELEAVKASAAAEIARLTRRNEQLEARAVLALQGPHAAEAEPILARLQQQATRIEQAEAQLADLQARVRMAESQALNGGPA